MKDAETGQRGYILTGQESYLEPYQAVVVNIDQKIVELKDLIADQPSQQKQFAALESLIAAKFAILKQTIYLRQNQGFEAALQVIQTNQGNILWMIFARSSMRSRMRIKVASTAVTSGKSQCKQHSFDTCDRYLPKFYHSGYSLLLHLS